MVEYNPGAVVASEQGEVVQPGLWDQCAQSPQVQERQGVREAPSGITRSQMDRLGIGQDLQVLPWGSKKVKLPPSTL
jgi:hypothetical protein